MHAYMKYSFHLEVMVPKLPSNQAVWNFIDQNQHFHSNSEIYWQPIVETQVKLGVYIHLS